MTSSLGFYRDDNGMLCVQNNKVSDLAKKYGTPLFIYDSGLMKERYNAFLDAVKDVRGTVHYAVKANDSLGIINYFTKLGCGADIVSIGEFKKCIAAGMSPKKIIFSGVGKERHEIEFALKNDILQFNVESEEEIDDISHIASKLKIVANVCLRINPNIAPDTHKKISTGEKETKFGIDFKNVKPIYHKLQHLHYINPVGLAVHIGSQIFDFNFFYQAYSNLKILADDLKNSGYNVSTLDLGGGIGINYHTSETPDLSSYKKIVSNLFLNSSYNLSFEPGRSLIAEAGILITKVIRNKKTNEKKFVIIDAAMNNLIRPTLYDAYHKIEPVQENDRSEITVDIVGPICETGDYIALNRKINQINENEFLAIRTTGAYASVMSSNYNARPDAKEIMVYNNQDYLIKNIETIKDIISKEKMIKLD
ncbi:diaminopimelate decarboxylase [Alphaproteobacteria bacterium]|nr:diaminopimelate decarboxylase [Alphaproteobacteria bacterium]